MLLIGIDQSQKEHEVCIMDVAGCQLARLTIPDNAEGFQRLHECCQMLQASPQECSVALESGYSLLVDYLLDHNYQVYVIPGKAVDRYRDRHRQSRSSSDKGDASVLAHILRTDRELHTPWEADNPLTGEVRSQVKLVLNLKRAVVRFSNQLRTLLWRYYPVAADLFSRLDAQIGLAFIQAYPTPQAAKHLTKAEFTLFCREHKYGAPTISHAATHNCSTRRPTPLRRWPRPTPGTLKHWLEFSTLWSWSERRHRKS
jgi:transposase